MQTCIFVDTEESETTPNLKSCLSNAAFLSHLVWFTILNLRFQYFIGTLNQYLTRVLGVASEGKNTGKTERETITMSCFFFQAYLCNFTVG